MKKKNIFLGLSIRYCYYIIAFISLSFLLSTIVVKGSRMISGAVDDLFAGRAIDMKHLIINTMVLVGISVIAAFVKYICGEMFSIHIQKDCKNKTVSHLSELEYSYFAKNSGSVITKVTADIAEAGRLFSETLPDLFQKIVTSITIGTAIFMIDWKLLLGILICFPIVFVINNYISKKTIALTKERRGKHDAFAETIVDNIAGIEIARSYELREVLDSRVDGIAKDILKNEYSRSKYQSIANGTRNFIMWLPSVICSVIALIEVLNGRITLGALMGFIVLFNKISDPLSNIPATINEGLEMMVSVNRINEILNFPSEHSGNSRFAMKNTDKYVMELNNVTFSYEENQNRKIFDGLNVSFEKGKITAVVGGSGAGKSTLFKLLCGFERIHRGSYLLFGHEFDKWNLKEARNQIALVSQNVFLYPDTIAANVAFGNEKATMEEIIQACKKANIHDFIMSLPDTYYTLVGERGTNLSGGERQRISIARAFLKKAPIFLLDEPTSALDTKTEEAIQSAINNISEDITVIIIAHRLSTIRNAHKIVVFDSGSNVESGTHEELLQNGGVYAKLYELERNIS